LKRPISLADGFDKRKRAWLGILVIFLILFVVGYTLFRQYGRTGIHFMRLQQFWENPEKYSQWGLTAGERCGDAPFLIPTDGFVAFFWGDRYRSGAKHQGIDIFSPEGPQGIGLTPVVAVHEGYLTRLPNWRSAVIIRIPSDPLQNGRQIWAYYAHMADAEGHSFILSEFPPGSSDVFVEAGTLIGYQGNYSADPTNPTGVHLHFSIVLDDGNGRFKNELEFRNTLDPSPYLGFELNGDRIGNRIATCAQ
jgi:murein DD-endopeptidase MepM/ murein hydrolase activator NlpD